MRMLVAVAALISFLSCSIVIEPRTQESVWLSSKRDVFVFAEEERVVCSGVILETHLILTSRHCLGRKMTVGGKTAEIVKVGSGVFEDLALIRAETGPVSRITMRDPHFEKITQTGYNWKESKGLLKTKSFGRAFPLFGGFFLATVNCPKGHSGSGVFGKDGNLLGIIAGGLTRRGNAAISASKIDKFLKHKQAKIGS